MTSLSPLLSPETGSPGTQSFGMTSTFPGMTSPSSLVAAYSHRGQLTSSSSGVSNMTASSVEDGDSSTELDLVFDLQSDFSSPPASVAMDTVSSPRSSRCQHNQRHCSDNDYGITSTIQLMTPVDSSPNVSAASVGQEMSEIEKELLLETRIHLPQVDILHLGKWDRSGHQWLGEWRCMWPLWHLPQPAHYVHPGRFSSSLSFSVSM